MAGCGSLPVQKAQDTAQGPISTPLPPSTTTFVRVGVEYLPPENESETALTRRQGREWFERHAEHEPAEPAQPDLQVLDLPVPTSPVELRRLPELQERWSLKREQIRMKKDPIERVTLRFLSEIIGDDRKRVQRAIGGPLLHAQLRREDEPMANFLDQRDREDRQRILTKNGTRMIRRPLRNAIRELPIFHDVESAIQDFKDKNRKYTDKREEGYGRISMRVRANSNPIELVWIRGGLRVASNIEYGKASFSTHLTEDLKIGVRSKFDYNSNDWRLFGSLEYDLNDFTTFYALAGNEINILGGPASFPGGPQSEETSKGVLLYFEHQF